MNKFYQPGIYSKTYNSHNNENGSTKLVNGANQTGQYKSNVQPLDQAAIFKSNGLRFYVNKSGIYPTHNPINSSAKYYFKSTHNRILKNNNYQFSFKNLKQFNKQKLKLKFKNSNLFSRKYVYNKPNATASNISKYKKIYRTSNLPIAHKSAQLTSNLSNSNSVPNYNHKYQLVHDFRKKAVKSSINCLLKKNNKLKLSTINTVYCMFFVRYGKCAKIDTCPYKHDKDKIRMCKGLEMIIFNF